MFRSVDIFLVGAKQWASSQCISIDGQSYASPTFIYVTETSVISRVRAGLSWPRINVDASRISRTRFIISPESNRRMISAGEMSAPRAQHEIDSARGPLQTEATSPGADLVN